MTCNECLDGFHGECIGQGCKCACGVAYEIDAHSNTNTPILEQSQVKSVA
jgi:hypothetical protein